MSAAASSTQTPVVFNIDSCPPERATDFRVLELPEAYSVLASLPTGERVKVGLTSERFLAVVGEVTMTRLLDSRGDEDAPERVEVFQRAISLPERVDESAITAKLDEQGYLTVNLPKRGTIRPKKVKV
mmetsp:Transcript_29230/g.75000  ORF Transcript_29230/g.75000 Transcript_29230/m.75000 type:complete len:128 (-) Transcript_29230:446-829(-)